MSEWEVKGHNEMSISDENRVCITGPSSACEHFAPFQVTLIFVVVLHGNLSMCRPPLLRLSYVSTALAFYGLNRNEYWMEGGQTICDNALEKDYGILDICACMCVCVRAHMPMWIRRCPGGPLFSFGPSNPFKSAC